jgi:uncharacterized oxidoreductase
MLPGDPERRYRRQREAEGIPIDATTWGQLLLAGTRQGMAEADLLAIAQPR